MNHFIHILCSGDSTDEVDEDDEDEDEDEDGGDSDGDLASGTFVYIF